ncbi:MAG: NAD(P)/FAD-dependent oxidoreductase [Flavobacteriales bacterium]|nr:NAD(P)/FAD-dependent oxidoreductase [Flavobacteriales bacterium]
MTKHTVIIGNGISGVTAARHIRKLSANKITIISAETEYFFSRTALMYVYMGHMNFEHIKPYEDHFWKKNRIDLKKAFVEAVDTDYKQLKLSGGEIFDYDDLIIASGSKPNKFGWKGQDLPGVQGLYSWQDLELMEENTKDIQHALIVGGGLIGVEMAEMLTSRGIGVTFLVREDRFWGNILPKEEGGLISRHLKSHHIDLRLESELEEIIAGEDGRVEKIKTKAGEIINCQFVGLTVGVIPNIEFIKNSKIETNRGVLVNEFLETNVPNVYAIGDCAEFIQHPTGRKNIEQVWYTGKMMGETIAQSICGNKTAYKPGVWFNSAKFFDIEYQTYGQVSAVPNEDEIELYWEHSKQEKCIKLVYNKNENNLVGVNAFGIRIRHQVIDKWIKEKTPIYTVLDHLNEANFDPEFFENNIHQLAALFKNKLPENA